MLSNSGPASAPPIKRPATDLEVLAFAGSASDPFKRQRLEDGTESRISESTTLADDDDRDFRPHPPGQYGYGSFAAPSAVPQFPQQQFYGGPGNQAYEAEPTSKLKASQQIVQANQAMRKENANIMKRREVFLYHHRKLFSLFLGANNKLDNLGNDPAVARGAVEPFKLLPKQPSCLTVTLKDYQLYGLSWLIHMYENGVNGILGDEMGLGKTVQTLSLLAYLKQKGIRGPHLIIAPLSVLESWIREIKKFTPTLKALRFHGVAKERQRLKAIAQAQKEPYDVIVTTYEMMVCEESWFKHRYAYRYVVIDEGHKIKNDQSQLGQAVQTLSAQHRLLLTGTPLQNNLRELWSLLHWLMPDVFTVNTSQVFEEGFNISRGILDTAVMESAKNLLERFMLRRLKSQVDLNIPQKSEMNIYLPLTPMQKWWYKRMITRLDNTTLKEIFDAKMPKTDTPEEADNESTVAGETNSNTGEEMAAAFQLEEAEELVKKAGGDRQWTKLMGLLFQLRKVTNHPYLLPGSEPEPYQNGEHLILASSKFILLDKLLPKLKKEGHRVLIFSGFTRMLDILEDYLNFRGFNYSRLDGTTSRAKRNLDIKLFQKSGSENFVYLLSTRAGGLGINLTGADTCIFYDSDWNPQADLQAMARCHRIGQTKPVTIYRLVTQDTVEERILARTLKKLYLSLKVTEECQDANSTEPKFTRNDLISMIRSGSRSVVENTNPLEFVKADIEEILEKSKVHAQNLAAALESEKADDEIEAELFQNTEDFGLRFFDGETHTSSRADVGKEWKDLMKRATKERTVKIAGHMVLAETIACGEWEAVKTITSAKKPEPAATAPSKYGKRPSPRDFNYDDECFECHEGGLIMLCSRCPRVYHPRCVNLTKQDVARVITWTCPQHRCRECQRVTTDAGGLLFRCVGCPSAWCEDCLPDEDKIEPIGDTNPYLESRGFGYVKQAYYIKCDGCCQFERDVAEGKVPPRPEHPLEVEDDFAPPVKQVKVPSERKPRAPRGSRQDPFYAAYKPDSDGEKAAKIKADREARKAEREKRKWGWPADEPLLPVVDSPASAPLALQTVVAAPAAPIFEAAKSEEVKNGEIKDEANQQEVVGIDTGDI